MSLKKKLAVKDLLESTSGLTFRKTFTPAPVCPQLEQTDEKTIFSKLCELFGKDVQSMSKIYDADSPALAAGQVLGYSYQESPADDVDRRRTLPAGIGYSYQESADDERRTLPAGMGDPHLGSVVDGERLCHPDDAEDIADDFLLSQRRREILRRRRQLFENEPADDVWKAVPAIADPDNDDSIDQDDDDDDRLVDSLNNSGAEENRDWSFTTESLDCLQVCKSSLEVVDRTCWDPDAAFAEVELELQDLHPQGPHSPTGSEDKLSDDSGMSSGSNNQVIYSISSKNMKKPNRKSKHPPPAELMAEEELDSRKVADRNETNNYVSSLADRIHIYDLADDNPIIIDTIGGPEDSHSRIRMDFGSSLTMDNESVTSPRFASLTNLSTTMNNFSSSVSIAVSNAVLQPINQVFSGAVSSLKRAAEPIGQRLQMLSVRLQERYENVARNHNWTPRPTTAKEACHWVQGVPKVT